MAETVDRKSRIIRESIRIVAEKGLSSLTAREVAKRLRIQSSSVFYYFPTHTDLFKAAQNYAMEAAEQQVLRYISDTGATRTIDVLKGYFYATVVWAFENPSHVKLLTSSFVDSPEHDFANQHQLTTGRGVEKVYQWLAICVAESEIPQVKSLRLIAEATHSTLTGACIKVAISPPKDRDELHLYTEMLWTMVLSLIKS
jgi:AcrR family transcriptional regulator